MNRPLLATCFLSLAALFSALAMGCSENADEPTFDVDGGDELAREMLPDAGSFPGTGWEFTAGSGEDEDDGDNDFDELCEALATAFAELEEEFDAFEPAGSAGGEYTMESGSGDVPLSVSVEVEVEIYEDADAVKGAVTAFDQVLNSDEFEDCMRAAVQEGVQEDGDIPEGLEVNVEKASPAVPAPRNGAEMGIDAQIAFLGVSVEMSMRMYMWRIGNALEFVFMTGTEDDLTDQFVETVLERIDGAAIVAARNQ